MFLVIYIERGEYGKSKSGERVLVPVILVLACGAKKGVFWIFGSIVHMFGQSNRGPFKPFIIA